MPKLDDVDLRTCICGQDSLFDMLEEERLRRIQRMLVYI